MSCLWSDYDFYENANWIGMQLSCWWSNAGPQNHILQFRERSLLGCCKGLRCFPEEEGVPLSLSEEISIIAKEAVAKSNRGRFGLKRYAKLFKSYKAFSKFIIDNYYKTERKDRMKYKISLIKANGRGYKFIYVLDQITN